jgi:hypothetical protein
VATRGGDSTLLVTTGCGHETAVIVHLSLPVYGYNQCDRPFYIKKIIIFYLRSEKNKFYTKIMEFKEI